MGLGLGAATTSLTGTGELCSAFEVESSSSGMQGSQSSGSLQSMEGGEEALLKSDTMPIKLEAEKEVEETIER